MLHFHETYRPSYMFKNGHLSFLVHKNNTIHIMLECMKHSLNNREDNPSQVCKQ